MWGDIFGAPKGVNPKQSEFRPGFSFFFQINFCQHTLADGETIYSLIELTTLLPRILKYMKKTHVVINVMDKFNSLAFFAIQRYNSWRILQCSRGKDSARFIVHFRLDTLDRGGGVRRIIIFCFPRNQSVFGQGTEYYCM